MSDERTHDTNLKSLFIRSLEIQDAELRQKYVHEACGQDGELRDELERLLGAHDLHSAGPLERVERWLEPFQLQIDTQEETRVEDTTLPSIVGPYELLEPIGEGGMGTVYRALQSEPVRREVALKLIKPGMDSREVLARFEAEMQTLGMMQHPNIASVLDAGLTSRGRPYFVMELVKGRPIDRYCNDTSATVRQRLELFISVCQAVQHAHHRGIIHRDLKPSNVLVLEQDEAAHVKVIDFGIAKALTSEAADQTRLTRLTELVGTPLYMSPEQIRDDNQSIDTRSDIYSLGVLLYELVTGSPPIDRATFKAASVERVRQLITEEIPPRPSLRRRLNDNFRNSSSAENRFGRELDWILLRALEKEPERRYASAQEFAEDLQRYLEGTPVHAGPPSVAYRLQAKMRKHRTRIAFAAALTLVLVIASVTAHSLYWKAQQEHHLRELREQQASELRQASSLQAAIRALSERNLSAMGETLREMQPAAPTDSISIESSSTLPPASLVQLLSHIANPAPQASQTHSAAIRGIACSTATQQLFGVDELGQVFRCDLSLESPIEILGSHTVRADSVAISPDGKRLVSASLNGEVWLWDVETKRLLRQLQQLESGVETLVWSPDGEAFAAGARYKEFVVYSSDGDELLRRANDHRHESLLFSHDGKQLIVPTQERLEVWDLESRKLARSIDTDRISNVRTMCWAGPNGQWLIAGERFSEGLVAIDFRSGKTLGSFNVGAQYACGLSGSANGKAMVAAYTNGRIQLIHLSELLTASVDGDVELTVSAHRYTDEENAPMEVQWIDRYRFITAAADGAIKLWDADQLRPSTVLNPPREMLGVGWTGERSLARYFLGDRVGQAAGASPAASSDSESASQPESGGNIGFVPHVFDYAEVGNRLAVAGEHRIGILNVATRRLEASFESPISVHHFVSLSADGTHLAATSETDICVWRSGDAWKSRELVQTWPILTTIRPVFSHDCEFLIASKQDGGDLLELEIASGRVLHNFGTLWRGDCELNSGGDLLAAASKSGLHVLDLRDNSVVFEVADVSQPLAFHFFDQEQVLVSGHLSGEVLAWHLPTQQLLGSLFIPQEWLGRIVDFQPSPDGTGLLLRYRNPSHIRPAFLGRVDLNRK